jgi:TolB-like protein/cytochrome c-type biogenesis protein CcmH/NrfG
VEIEPAVVRSALERLLASRTFSRSAQLRHFLEYTVGRSLTEPKPSIKEYTIAIEVFGRPASYDPRADPIVRTEALRLRKKLASYYQTEGKDETVRIEYPKGSYVPAFVGTRSPAPPATPAATAEPPSPPATRSRLSAWLAVGILGVSIAGLVFLLLRSAGPGVSTPRVGVLTFRDVSSDPVNDDFALAMSESILTRLADVEQVEIASRSALHAVRGGPLSRSQMASTMGADYLIDGTVARSDDSFQVTARLIRARDDREVWTKSFDFSWPEIFEAQNQVARDIAEQLLMSEVSLKEVPATDLAAYEAYVKGRYSAVQFMNTSLPTHFEEAQRRLLEAVEIDPGLSDAWAELGRIHYGRLYPPQGDRAAILEEARGNLEKALAIDASNAAALQTMGLVYAQSGQPLEGIDFCRRATEIDPEVAGGHDELGQIYMWLGFYESALAEFDEAIQHDPLTLSAFHYKALVLSLFERGEDALATARVIDERFPDIPGRQLFLGEVYYRMGDRARAEALWREGQAALPTDDYEIALALTAVANGNPSEGRRVLEKYRGTPYRDQAHLTELAAMLDDAEYAVGRIDGHPERNYRWLVSERSLARLADDPSFAELTRTLHAEWSSNLEALGDSLPVPPPTLPDPEQFFARGSR